MLELTTLSFKVNTEQLTDAIKKTDQLIAAQKELGNLPSSPSNKPSRNPSSEPKKQIDLVKKLTDLYGDLADGSNRWEASQLRAARAAGISVDEIYPKLLKLRELSPLSSFDSSVGALRKVNNELDSLKNRVQLTKEGIIATKSELEAFGRIPFQVQGSMQKRGGDPLGKDSLEYNMQSLGIQGQFLNRAKEISALRIAEKERLEVVKLTSAAEKFLVAEMQRMDAVLGEMNSEYGLNVRTQQLAAEATAKYAMNLKRAGIEGAEATRRMEEYRKKVSQVADIDKKRAGERLSNALAPQISDVAVSIAGGMPLHLIAMQQGLQIRDLIGQSKVDVQDLQKVFRESMSKMVTSIGGTITALGQMALGGLVDAGKAVNNFAGNITGLNATTSALSTRLPALAGGIAAVGAAMNVVAGLGIGLLITGIAAVTYEFVKLIGANNDLARTLAVTGGVFGANYEQAQNYAQALERLGVDNRTAAEAISAMAAAGGLTASQIEKVTLAAIDMERYGNVAIKDTIKSFSDMAKDPVKALTELAIKTGDVPPEIVKMVRSLVEQGKSSQAAAIAVDALRDHTTSATSKMKEDLNGLTLVFLRMKEAYQSWKAQAQQLDDEASAEAKNAKLTDAIIKQTEARRALQNATSLGQGGTELSKRQREVELSRFAVETERENLKLIEKKSVAIGSLQQANSKAVAADAKLLEVRAKFDKDYIKDQKIKELDAAKAVGLSQKAYDEELKRINESDKKKGGEAGKQSTYELGIQEKINDAYNQMIGKVKELNTLEKLLLDIRDDPRYAKMSKSEKAATEQKIKDLKQQAQVEISTKEMLIQTEKDAETIRKEQKKSEEDIAELYRELTIHGEKYEKTLLDINKARDLGVIKTDAEAERLRKENLLKNSNASKYFKKEEKDSNKVDRDLDYAEEDMLLRQLELSRTDRVNQLARSEFETKKNLAKEYNEFYLKETEILDSVEGQQQADLLTALLEQHERKKGLILAEGELKKKVLSEEQERQKNFDSVVKKGFESMGDALVDFAVTGKSSFGDMVKQMLIDLAKLEMRMQFMKIYEGLSGGGGILGKIFGGFGGFADVGGLGGFANDALGSILGGTFAKGGVFESGVQKFAKGGAFTNGIVDTPTRFNIGEMGEAGAEAIMPLRRGRDGSLGVASSGGNSKKVVNMSNTYNIQIDSRSDQASIYAGVQSMLQQNNAKLVDSLQTGGHLV